MASAAATEASIPARTTRRVPSLSPQMPHTHWPIAYAVRWDPSIHDICKVVSPIWVPSPISTLATAKDLRVR